MSRREPPSRSSLSIRPFVRAYAAEQRRAAATAGGRAYVSCLVMTQLLRGRASQLEIGRALALDKSFVSSTVAALIADGLVVRRVDPGDGRVSRLSLTSSGRKAAQETERKLSSVDAKLTSHLSRVEIERVRSVFVRLGEALEAVQARNSERSK